MSAFAFADFVVDAGARRVTRGGDVVPIPDRHFGVLLHLLAHAGTVVSKDGLIESAWSGLAVTDNSLEQAISGLRRVLGDAPDGTPYIQTVPRQGYRFTGVVTRPTVRASDDSLEALLAPHRAWIDGRAALETLEADQIVRARGVFEGVLRSAPDQAPAHVGLANACIMQFEMTRADESPDVSSLTLAAQHAREACRLGPDYGEAWATLGFVLDRTGRHADALAASRRAVTLEADNWRHHLRLAYVSWGEERLREAGRALALLPGFPLAHWLCATVHVARQALDEAERELDAGIAARPASRADRRASAASRCTGCAVWCTWRAATSVARSSHSSASCRSRRAVSCMRANAARTPGTRSVRFTRESSGRTRLRQRFTRHSYACQDIHWRVWRGE